MNCAPDKLHPNLNSKNLIWERGFAIVTKLTEFKTASSQIQSGPPTTIASFLEETHRRKDHGEMGTETDVPKDP